MSKKVKTLKQRYNEYRRGVKNAKIIASQAVIQAIERAYKDDKRKDIEMDFSKPERVVQFIEGCLCHFEGEWAGKPFILQPWQIFVVCELFGRLKNGIRKYTTAYIQTGRKNGKSTFLASLGAYSVLGAQEAAAQVYSVATTREQAQIVRDQARIMLMQSPLKKYVKELNRNIHIPKTNSKFIALSADANTLDGLNPSFSVIDELAAHPTDRIWGVMTTATASRKEPLTVAITTPLFLREQSVALDRYHYGKQILSGALEDESFFPFICELDNEDDWLDQSVWGKANPSLNVCCFEKTLLEMREQAKIIPATEYEFKMRHLALWQEDVSSWISLDDWDSCQAPADLGIAHLKGRECFGGLDLADTDDFSAFALIFPGEGGEPLDVLTWFWCPQAMVAERKKRGRIPYHHWVRSKHLTATPGNQIEYQDIEKTIIELSSLYRIKKIGYDRHSARRTAQVLEDESLTVEIIKQTAMELSEATKEARRLVMTGKLRHYGNPVMRFCVGNVLIGVDSNLNEKIMKQKSADKVDGAAALVDAVKAYLNEEEEEFRSVYADRGVLVM